MKINITNEEKLATAIKEAEGKATARTVTVDDIRRTLAKIGNGIAKAKLHGTTVHYTGAEHFPNAYRFRPESTHWVAKNIKGKWYVVKIFRDTCPNRTTWNTEVDFSDEAKKAIIDKMSYNNY